MIERNKTNVALEGMFEDLFKLISDARHMPLTDKIMLDENDLLNILDDLKDAIPREIKSANQVLEEQKSIVEKAYADADMIVQQARDEAKRIIGTAQAEADAKLQQEEIVKQANAFAEEVKADALRYQGEIRTEADNYALSLKKESLQYAGDMLAYMSSKLDEALKGMQENQANVEAEMHNITDVSAQQERELTKEEEE